MVKSGDRPAPSARFLVSFAVVWLTVTLPLLNLGYGSDTDSWLVARVADVIWTTHKYNPSRSSGFPLFEIGISPFVHSGRYWVANLLPFLGGVSLLVSLAVLGRKRRLRHPRLVMIFIGFLPVVLKNATCTIDYALTLSFLSWAYVALTSGRYAATMVLVGVACGFRPQTVLYFPPLALYLWWLTRSFKKAFVLGAIGATTAVLCYSPVLLTTGPLSGYKDYALGVVGQTLMFGYNGFQVLGIIPTLLLAGIVIYAVRARKQGAPDFNHEIPHLYLHLGVCAIYLVAFAAMPHEPEYLLPAVLSLVFMMDSLLDHRLMIAATCAALSYHAFRIETLGGVSAHRKLKVSIKVGYLARDIAVRRWMVSTRDALTNFTPDRPTYLMFGSDWATTLNPAFEEVERFTAFRKKGTEYYVADPVTDAQVDALRARGLRVVLWKGFAKDFMAMGPKPGWESRVDVVDSLDDYLGAKIEGQPMFPSEE